MSTYAIENSKSGRSKCKHCKETIAKGELRVQITTHNEAKDMNMTSSYKVACFNVPPKKFKGVSAEDFVDEHLEDNTEDQILANDTKRLEVIDAIGAKRPKKAKKEGDAGEGDTDNPEKLVKDKLEKIKAAAAKLEEEDEDEKEPPAKKVKGEGNEFTRQLKAFLIYGKISNGDLKDVLTWNGNTKTGTKSVLVMKCIDGYLNGRLHKQCSACEHGRLTLNLTDGFETVKCQGGYNEEAASRMPACGYEIAASKAPRFQPWYSQQPTEEQKKEMEVQAEGKTDAEIPQELIQAVKNLDWPATIATDASSMKAAAHMMAALLTEGRIKVDLPEGNAYRSVGMIINNNKESSAIEILEIIVKEFGFAETKVAAKKAKTEATASSCKCAANGPVVAAIKELSDLYFKENNANAGKSYNKAAKALGDLTLEITAGNAMGLSKGKTKVPGIGKGTAEKLKEFFTTGTISKLEEKRALLN